MTKKDRASVRVSAVGEPIAVKIKPGVTGFLVQFEDEDDSPHGASSIQDALALIRERVEDFEMITCRDHR